MRGFHSQYRVGYTYPVTSKKGVMRAWQPGHLAQQAAPIAGHAAFVFLHAARMAPFMAGRAGTRASVCRFQVPVCQPRYGLPPILLAGGGWQVHSLSTWSHTMADASLRASAPTLAVVDGIPTTTSVDLARHFGKQHRNVVQSIEGLIAQLPAGALLNFQQGVYTLPETGDQQHKMYRLTRDGFALLAMGFTGKRALQFKLAYIEAFNRMEEQLSQAPAQMAAPPAARAAQPRATPEMLDKVDLSVELPQLMPRLLFAALMADPQPLPGAKLPQAVRAQLHQKTAQIAAQAVPGILQWVVDQHAQGQDVAGLDYASWQASRLAHIAGRLLRQGVYGEGKRG